MGDYVGIVSLLNNETNDNNQTRRFGRFATAGITFQGGSAAVDSSTIIATLVHSLTGSAFAVGAASAALRFGWLFPQIFIAYLAQQRRRRMPFYIVGAFGRATCLALLATVLASAAVLPVTLTIGLFFVFWIAYSFISGIVAVPYNDIIGRSIASERRSRLLALRFFGGGVLALIVAAVAHQVIDALSLFTAYAIIIGIGAVLMYTSSILFVSAGEPEAPPSVWASDGFWPFVRRGVALFRTDDRFRLFVYSQWCGGVVMMALPFYVVQAMTLGVDTAAAALLLAAQTAGALASNALWGWWGDTRGKVSLLHGVALLRVLPPVATLCLVAWETADSTSMLVGFGVIFFGLGALSNGVTIALIGYLMEISPNDQRPAYSGYFNAIVAPASLLPLAAAAVVTWLSLASVFYISFAAALIQFIMVHRLTLSAGDDSSGS